MEIMKDQGKPIPLLDYADFVVPPYGGTSVPSVDRLPRFLFENLLRPGDMPIHPTVYNQPELYTGRFVDRIYQSMPASLGADVSATSRVLRVDLGIVENDGTFSILHQDTIVCQIGQTN